MASMQARIYPVVMAGGSGTRLWPLSRQAFPKQLLPLASEGSMLQETLRRLATAAFVKPFGWGVMLAAIPVLAYQGTITLAARSLEPYLQDTMLLNSISATGGLLVLCISVVILDIAKVPLADYLPSLAVAPILTWLFG